MTRPRWQFTMGSAMTAIAAVALVLSLPAEMQVLLAGVGFVILASVALSLGMAGAVCLVSVLIERLAGPSETPKPRRCPPN